MWITKLIVEQMKSIKNFENLVLRMNMHNDLIVYSHDSKVFGYIIVFCILNHKNSTGDE
jgi:hypothetical protein